MAHEDQQRYLDKDTFNQTNVQEEKSTQQLLIEANKEIEDLKLQLAWLERPYE